MGGMPGKLFVTMVFSDEYDEDAEKTLWFNKRERFLDTFFGITMWDYVINYGFTHLPDGRCECYHQAEYFNGYLPPLTLATKLFFRIHARYMVWATEHHINHYAFTSETEEDEHKEHESRTFLLLRMFKEHFVDDVKASVVGSTKDTDSFLTKKEDEEAPQGEAQEEAQEEGDEENIQKLEDLDLAKPKTVLLNRRSTVSSFKPMKDRIEEDIAFDKEIAFEIAQDALDRARSTGRAFGDAYQLATLAAMQKHQTRIMRRRTTNRLLRKKSNEEVSSDEQGTKIELAA